MPLHIHGHGVFDHRVWVTQDYRILNENMAAIKLDCWKLIRCQPQIVVFIPYYAAVESTILINMSHKSREHRHAFYWYLIFVYFLLLFCYLYCGGSDIHTLFLHQINFKSRGNCDCPIIGNLKINLRWRNYKWRCARKLCTQYLFG